MTIPEQSRFDFDHEIETAWSTFEAVLAARLDTLPDGECLLLETMGEHPTEGALPYVQLVSFADAELRRCEVSANAYLAPEVRMTREQESLLDVLGFTAPDPEGAVDADGDLVAPNWFRDEEADGFSALAAVAVQVLRDVFGVVHPSLLAHAPAPVDAVGGPGARHVEKVQLDTAYLVTCPDELAEIVDRTFVTLTGKAVERDEDGDWELPFAGHMAWLTMVSGKPVLRLFAWPVRGVRSRRAAVREVAILNRDSELIRYHLVGDDLRADLDLPAGPFVPRHLASCVSTFHTTLAAAKGDFAARTGGSI